MNTISCGIDFGTSNSSIALANQSKIELVPIEHHHTTIPSALFFEHKTTVPHFGREAVDFFFSRKEGRFMRSLKRVLGTSVMKQGTLVNGKPMKFEQIIGAFLQNIKTKADAKAETELLHVVMGRPVHFIDNDDEGNIRAQNELKNIAEQIGFKHIEFQFEPIAAAFAHETKIDGEKLAIVVDLGGGTSDFTVIRLSNKYVNKTDRASDILANTGVRIGGNDFDKELSLAAVMPEIGYRTTYGEKNLEVPPKLFNDLAEWSKVNFLYTTKIISQTRQILHQAHDKKRYGRLLQVLEQETGHSLLAFTEEAKIGLTLLNDYAASLDFVQQGLEINISRKQFEEAIHNEIEKISKSAMQCVQLANVKSEQIELVILTGGTTEVPAVQTEFRKLFPNASFADKNKLSSVGLGLAYDAINKFGG